MSQIKTKFIENAAITDTKVATGIDAAKLADGSVSNAEFQFINSVTSNVQTQINGKLTSTLVNAHIFVGNGSNVATDVAVSGDVTLANTGAVTIANNAITTAKIAADAVTGAKIRLDNNEFLRGRNAANSADINIIRVNTSNLAEMGSALDMNDNAIANSNDILPSADNTHSFGSSTLRWAAGFFDQLADASGALVVSITNRTLSDGTQVVLDFLNRILKNSSGTSIVDFSTDVKISTDIEVLPAAGAASEIHMFNDAGDFKSVVSADPALAADTLLQLPPDNGTAGYVLSTNGAGVTSWVAGSGSSSTNEKETFVLNGTNITNQYVDLANVALVDSIHFAVKGAPSLLEGASYDYSVSYTGGAGGNTRITFLNDLATGGNAALIATDVVQVQYQL